MLRYILLAENLDALYSAETHRSVGSNADLRTGGSWFDPRLGQHSFRGLMKVIAMGFIPLSPLPVVSTCGKAVNG